MVSKTRFISMEDVEHLKDIEFESPLHMLAAVAYVASKLQTKEGKKPISDGEASSSSAATHKKIKFKLPKETISGGEKSSSSTATQKKIKFILPSPSPPPQPPTPRPEKKRKIVQQPSRPLPEEVRRAIGELAGGRNVSPPMPVIEKKLFKTDVAPNNLRFSIPLCQIVREEFLRDEEKEYLASKRIMEEVKILVPSMEWKTVVFKMWYYNTSSTYCLYGSGWTKIVEENQLHEGMLMQLWSFRIDQELCFALLRLS